MGYIICIDDIVSSSRREYLYQSIAIILSMVYCNYIEHSIINPTLNENNELSSCVSMQ